MKQIAWFCVLGAVLCWPLPTRAQALTDQQIAHATDILKSFLYSQQQPDGSWEDGKGTVHARRHAGGKTSLAVLAMLYAGEPFQSDHGEHGGVAAALDWLEKAELWGTYSYALRAHVWAALPDEFGSRLRRDAQHLARAHRNSLFDYDSPPRPRRVDHSVTQYGVLGMWEYAKRSGTVPATFWRNAADHFVRSQRADGGWNYEGIGDDEPSYGSMTTAGLTVLMIARQELLSTSGKPDPELNQAIDRGLDWLNQYFSDEANPAAGEPHPHRGDRMYYWYGIERVALASGVKTFNGLDWYRTGANTIIAELLTKDLSRVRASTDIVDACFGLMFLVRGRVPVWCQKLSLPDQAWNTRPDDLPRVTAHLSDRFEQRLNWSVTSIDEPLANWMLGPMAWLSLPSGLKPLTPEAWDSIERYLKHGGLLVINPEGKAIVRRELQAVAEERWPGATLAQADEDHPLLGLINEVKAGPGDRPWVLSQGARDLIVLLPERWGANFKRWLDKPGPQAEILANLFAAYTMRGSIPPRLITRYQQPSGPVEEGLEGEDILVFRASLSSETSGGVIEPGVWSMFAGPFTAATGKRFVVKNVPLAELKPGAADLVHLAGVGPTELLASETVALREYVVSGGVVFVETLGGFGDKKGEKKTDLEGEPAQYSRFMGQMFREAWDTSARPLRRSDVLLTAENLDRGVPLAAVGWRPYTRLRFGFGPQPRLLGFALGEGRVVISNEDVSLGVMDLRHDRIHGYDRETSRALLTNLLLWAASER